MSCEDITLIARAEEEKASLAEQLRQSQKMEAIGHRLAGGVAHDFNNLLTVIRGYSQLSLMDLRGNETLRGYLDEIQKATQRASDLTHHLLAYSRRQIMEMKILDLNTLLKDLDKMLHRVISEDIELTYRLSDDIGKVRVDPGQIEQVILNLGLNAVEAMPGGGRMTIVTGYQPERCGVYLTIQDTGSGIPAEVAGQVFDPFVTTKESGTGLGLTIAHDILQRHNGSIDFESLPGEGTTFKIWVPEGQA